MKEKKDKAEKKDKEHAGKQLEDGCDKEGIPPDQLRAVLQEID